MHSETSAELTTPSKHISADAACRNCGSQMVGKFCAQCGQKQHASRIRFASLWADARENLIDWEHGVFRTLWLLLSDPKQLMEHFVADKRKTYTHPFALLIATATLSFIVTATMGATFWQLFKTNLQNGNTLKFSPTQLDRYVDVFIGLNSVIPYWLLLFTLPTAFMLRLAFWRHRFNTAELWLITLYAMALAVGVDALASLIFFSVKAPYILMINSFNTSVLLSFLYVVGRTLGGRWSVFLRLLPIILLTAILMFAFVGYVARVIALRGP